MLLKEEAGRAPCGVGQAGDRVKGCDLWRNKGVNSSYARNDLSIRQIVQILYGHKGPGELRYRAVFMRIVSRQPKIGALYACETGRKLMSSGGRLSFLYLSIRGKAAEILPELINLRPKTCHRQT